MIGGKAPSEYLAQLQTHKTVQLSDTGMDSILKTHFISPIQLRANNFDAFIDSRRALLVEQISLKMGKAVNIDIVSESVADEEIDEY
jgi:hypothetical protein